MEKPKMMTVKDVENSQKGILALILAYPGYPQGFKADNTTVKWNSIGEERSIGVFPMQGARYTKKYVDGSYVAQIPLQIEYKSSPTSNKANIEAQELLGNLTEWMEESGMEYKDPHFVFEAIERTSPLFGGEQNEKNVIYAVNMVMKYFYKK